MSYHVVTVSYHVITCRRREIVTDSFDALYAALKPKGVTVSAMLAKAVAEVLKKHPIINAAYVEGGIKYNKDVNVAMAVAIDGGLITPTIIKVRRTSTFAHDNSSGHDDFNMHSDTAGARLRPVLHWTHMEGAGGQGEGQEAVPCRVQLRYTVHGIALSAHHSLHHLLSFSLSSLGTFTISNLGMFGVAQFDAILPPGTGSILAIAASTPKVVQLKNGHFGVQKSMTVTITCDHRHIYGADAAEFLKDLAGEWTLIALQASMMPLG